MSLTITINLLLLIGMHTGYTQSKPKATIKATLNHTAIYVANAKASAAFYQNILGLDSIAEPFHDGRHVWLQIAPGIAMHIIQGATTPKTYYKNHHTCFSVSDVTLFVTTLKEHAITWEDRDGTKQAVTTRVDGVHQLWLQDPDGYWLEVNDAK